MCSVLHAGKEVAGKEVAGKEVAGKEVAGKEVAGKDCPLHPRHHPCSINIICTTCALSRECTLQLWVHHVCAQSS